MSEALDAVDAKILDLIQHDAGLSVAEIAERVGLSSSPCWRRIKRLEDAGVIQRRVTILDREKLGLNFEVYCTVKLSLPTKDNLESFEQAIAKDPNLADAAVKDTARKSLEQMPEPVLGTVLRSPTAHPALLSLLAQLHKASEAYCEAIALNPATDDATIAWLATLPAERPGVAAQALMNELHRFRETNSRSRIKLFEASLEELKRDQLRAEVSGKSQSP